MNLKIKDIKQETSNSSSFIFEKPKEFNFYPGQYLDIELPIDDPHGKTRAFTISSSPTEDFLMITPKKGISNFKKYLYSLHPGDIISTSHPVGTFILDETESAVFLAGGIGITPFRSIINYVLDQKLSTPITLLYLNSDNNFLFKKELENWQNKLTNLRIIYHPTSTDGPFELTQLETIVQLNVNSTFYLAGPPKMVDNFAKMLLDLGIDETNIRYDRFDGY